MQDPIAVMNICTLLCCFLATTEKWGFEFPDGVAFPTSHILCPKFIRI